MGYLRAKKPAPCSKDGTDVVNVSCTLTGELKTLVKQSSHYLFGLIGSLGLGFISFPIFTRIFSVADYGLIDLAQKILLLFTAASKFGMQNSAMRFYNRESFSTNPSAARSYYSTMFFGVAVTAAVITCLLAASTGFLPKSFLDNPLTSILCFTSALVFVRAMLSMIWSFLRIEERTKLYNVVSIAMKAGTIAAVCLLLPLLGPSIRTYFSATMGVEFAILAALTVPLFRRGLLRISSFDSTLFRSGFVFGAPLILQEVAGIILDSGDRALVHHYLGADALGFYSVAYGLSTYVNSLLMAPLGLAILPIYMRLWTSEGQAQTTEFLSLSLDVFFMAAAAIFLVVTVSCHDAVLLLASPKYAGADSLIPMLVAGLLIYTTQVFLNAGLVIHKKTRAMALALACSAGLNLGLNCLLLPRMGLMAAAVGTLVSYAFCSWLIAHIAFKVLPLRVNYKALLGYGLATFMSWAAVAQLEFGSPIANVAAKPTLAFIMYAVILYALDRRIRDFTARVWRHLKHNADIDSPVAA
jgi:O-antigen/teichoic acid export membrane protein